MPAATSVSSAPSATSAASTTSVTATSATAATAAATSIAPSIAPATLTSQSTSTHHVPNILLIYTGGTIGMIENARTGALVPFSLSHLLSNVPKIGRLGYNFAHKEFNPPIDSSNMNPHYWCELAHLVADNYDAFDAFVILHGTDTMAYTASALSFMLQNLTKPVILTGSQLPIGEIREDGTENLITALQIAAARDEHGLPRVQEVAISFGRHLWRGNRSTKVSSTNFGAFRSFNYPSLADIDLHITYHDDFLLHPNPEAQFNLNAAMDDSVGVVGIYPGITEAALRPQLENPALRGLVLRTFGAGNAPTEPWFTHALASAVRNGKLLVNITQCPAGGVEEKRYATGDALAQAGVVSGFDMTFEAALTKMMHLFGQGLNATEAGQRMAIPLAGEVTV